MQFKKHCDYYYFFLIYHKVFHKYQKHETINTYLTFTIMFQIYKLINNL